MRPSLWCAGLVALSGAARAVVFSGEVRNDGAQAIFTPPSNSSPVVLRYYVADGVSVNAGDVILRIDASQAAAEIRSLDAQIEQARAKAAKEAAELDLKAADAELASIDADAALAAARVDAAIPPALVSALDYDRYQAALESTQRDAAFRQQQYADARTAAQRRREDGKLEVDKLRVQRDYDAAQVDTAEVRAARAGTVVHGFSYFSFGGSTGGRYEEGSSSFPGNKVGEIVGDGSMSVRAYVLEPDRAALRDGQSLRLGFDALPQRIVDGTITAISGASDAKPEWGSGQYFTVDIAIADQHDLALKPGMSVRVDSDAAPAAARRVSSAVAAGKAVQAAGEVYAQSTSTIAPPAVEDLWEMNVTQIADDGRPVKKGEVIVTLDGAQLNKQLVAKQSELQEKLRTQEKLRVEMAEKGRTESVTTAEAHAAAVKAERKASQPEAYVPGVQYRKLLIERHKAELKDEASRRREQVAAAERAAEQQMADADVARLQADVGRMQDGLARLNVTAPRDGIFLHASTWRGDKVDVGSQVWRGMSNGEIPDVATLAVRASLPERDLLRVARGDRVRIVLEGGTGQALGGRVEEIGSSVHSKSRVEPVPVVDLRISLDAGAAALKPGQPVRVELVPKMPGAAS